MCERLRYQLLYIIPPRARVLTRWFHPVWLKRLVDKKKKKKTTAVLAREAGWKLQAVLRPRRFSTRAQLFGLYKCQVLSYVESGMVAYYHAAPSLLHRIDRIQDRFLREIGVTPEESLEKHRLAPLTGRRDSGMLGL